MIVTYGIITVIALGVGYFLVKSSQRQKTPVFMTVGVIAIGVLIYFYIGNRDYSEQPNNIVQKKEQA